MTKKSAFDMTVNSLRDSGLNSEQILNVLSSLFSTINFSDSVNGVKKIWDQIDGNTEPVVHQSKSFTYEEKEEKLKDLFLALGIPRKLKGYQHLSRAVLLYCENPDLAITRDIYPQIAKESSSTYASIDKTMRYAIQCACNRSDVYTLLKFYGNTISLEKDTPTVSEFISLCAEWLTR